MCWQWQGRAGWLPYWAQWCRCGSARASRHPDLRCRTRRSTPGHCESETGAAVCIVCAAGRGGKGNHHFRGPRRQMPRFAQDGQAGQSGQFRLELRLIADIGLVGMPNAGKSSLQNLLTRAHAKVAAYPFTTTVPNLGVVRIFDEELVLADIPGLIAGAARGNGLGLQFLGHIERAAALLFVLDGAANCTEQFSQLRRELAGYDEKFASRLCEKPWAILLS